MKDATADAPAARGGIRKRPTQRNDYIVSKNGETKLSLETTMRIEAAFKNYHIATPVLVILFASCENEVEINKLIDGIYSAKATSYQLNLAFEEIFNKDIDGLKTCLADGLLPEILKLYKEILRQD